MVMVYIFVCDINFEHKSLQRISDSKALSAQYWKSLHSLILSSTTLMIWAYVKCSNKFNKPLENNWSLMCWKVESANSLSNFRKSKQIDWNQNM